MRLQTLVYGNTQFSPGSEYRKFQHRFACVLLLFGVVVTALFITATLFGGAQLHDYYLLAGSIYCVVQGGAYLILRARPDRLPLVAPFGVTASFLLESVAFFFNTADELRIIWFALSVPAAYVIMGRKAGLSLGILSVLFIVFANSRLQEPYSDNAIITGAVAILYIAAFFHAFSSKSISFHHAMVEANQKLADMASKDPLTGLFNARAYYALCDQALNQARRSDQPLAMLFIDLDHFKRINDTHGHEAGDTVLKAVAACLLDGARRSDIIGRIGGEEFSMLLPDTDMVGGQGLAEKLRQDVEALLPDIGGTSLKITASIGVAVARPHQRTVAEIQRDADECMYHAKRAGRNRVSTFEDGVAA
ncbi:putative diguanylate cyclase [Magnetospirillum sp. LM-5]|uniref:GGDEF domain-containing protein n=1 Tax=Magnetospirillum sp. LM-5 TaxID=2681466 RepID=UPI00138462C6|nr:GGDEF domain-containing protein [Magnetospirillum sp. LM-5]CAA7620990.1 putative diguanylate cyclase [Magnetospirillum sp. LM-5]